MRHLTEESRRKTVGLFNWQAMMMHWLAFVFVRASKGVSRVTRVVAILAFFGLPPAMAQQFYYYSETGDSAGHGRAKLLNLSLVQVGRVGLDRDRHATVVAEFGSYLFEFVAPQGTALTTGEYAFQVPNQGGSGTSGWIRIETPEISACSSREGTFTVLQISRDSAGNLLSFAANFVQRCFRATQSLSGQIRFNSSIPINVVRALPYAFQIDGVSGIPVGGRGVSNIFRIPEINTYFPISISGGEYSINGGTFVSSEGMIGPSDLLQVRSPVLDANQRVDVMLTVGGYSTPFIATSVPGTNPQPKGQDLAVLRAIGTYDAPEGVVQVSSPATFASLFVNREVTASGEKRIRIGSSWSSTGPPWAFTVSFGTAEPTLGTFENVPVSSDAYLAARTNAGPMLSFSETQAPYCVQPAGGRVVIHEYTTSGNGIVAGLALDYEVDCFPASYEPRKISRVVGHVRFNSQYPIDYSVNRPITIVFPGVMDAAQSTYYESPSRIVKGLTGPLQAAVENGEYSVDGGPYSAVAGVVTNGSVVRVRIMSAPAANVLRTATLRIGSGRYDFHVGTPVAASPQPDGNGLLVTMTVPGDPLQAIQTQVKSGATLYEVSTAGIDRVQVKKLDGSMRGSFTFSNLALGEFSYSLSNSISPPANYPQVTDEGIDPGHFGAQIRMHVRELERDATGIITRLAVDLHYDYLSEAFQFNQIPYTELYPQGVYPGWTISHAYHHIRINSVVPIDYTRTSPVPFQLPPKVFVPPDAWAESANVVIGGINAPAPITIENGEYAIDGGAFTSQPGVILNGQQLRLRCKASLITDKFSWATVKLGGFETNFYVGSAPAPMQQPRADTRMMTIYDQDPITGALSQRHYSTATNFSIRVESNGLDSATVRVIDWASSTSWDDDPNSWSYSFVWQPGQNVIPGTIKINPVESAYAPQFNVPGCGSGPGATGIPRSAVLRIHEYEYVFDPNYRVSKLAADFTLTCPVNGTGPGAATITGFVRYFSDYPISHQPTQPLPFRFPARLRQPASTVVQSEEVALKGFGQPLSISIVGGEYSLDGGAFTATSGTVSTGQNLRVRVTTPSVGNAIRKASVTVGDYTTEFIVGTEPGLATQVGGLPLLAVRRFGVTPAPDVETRVFSPALLDSVSAEWPAGGALIVRSSGHSDALGYTMTFWNNTTPLLGVGIFSNRMSLSISNESYCGEYLPNANSRFVIRELSAVGSAVMSVAIDFEISCPAFADIKPIAGSIRINSAIPIDLPPDRYPVPFSFQAKTNVPQSAWIESEPAIAQGFDGPLPISISGGEYSIDNGPFVSTMGTISNGQSIKVRVLSGATFNLTTTATLYVGYLAPSFSATTAPADTYPEFLEVPEVKNVAPSSTVLSAIVVVNGINAETLVHPSSYSGNATFGYIEVSVAGKPFTSFEQMVKPGETIQFRVTAPPYLGESAYGFVFVGGKPVEFRVSTALPYYSVNLTVVGMGQVTMMPGNSTCTAYCPASVNYGAQVTLTASPSAGHVFDGWSGGACSGIGSCTLTVTNAMYVTATFRSLAPSAPVIERAVPGNGMISFKLIRPTYTGNLPIDSYTVQCGTVVATAPGTESVVTVTVPAGLPAWQCWATATNSAGTSATSAVVTVSMLNLPPLELVGVRSRCEHGTAGEFDLPLRTGVLIDGAISVEPRRLNATCKVVYVFNQPVTSASTLTVIDGLGNAVAVVEHSAHGDEYQVRLPTALDKQRVSIAVAGVNGTLDATVALGFLIGDVDRSGLVTQGDVLVTRVRSGQVANRENFIYDINLSGMVSASDVVTIKRRLNNTLQ